MKNKYFILSWVFTLYPIILNFVFNQSQIAFIYDHMPSIKLAGLITNIIIGSLYVSVVLGVIFGVICLVKTKYQHIYVLIPISICILLGLSYIFI